MSIVNLLFVLSLPLVAQSYISQFGSYNITGMTLIYRGVYLFSDKDSPSKRKDGRSMVSVNIRATPATKDGKLDGYLETLITTEDVFKRIGYEDSEKKRIACCDEDAVKNNDCTDVNRLMIPKGISKDLYRLERTLLTGDKTDIPVTFTPTESGIYYVASAVCDYHVSPMVLDGTVTVVNPYGHLPAPQYGSLPFYIYMCIAYVIALVIWGMLCYKYSQEIMSVQIIIIVVLVSFVIDNIVKTVYLSVFNNTGNNVFALALISIFVDCTTRTLTRILTLVVCMGLGVCRATLGNSTCRFISFGISYFLVSFWDSYANMYPSNNETTEFIRLLITSGMDAVVYFWIFQSLMDTMDELQEKKQDAKLAIFSKLRTLLVVSVIMATLTLLAFSYIVINDYTHKVWKYQWFINDGIWSVYYFLLFFSIMLMWRPTENSSAYAYHIQVATDAQENDEEYGLPNEKLVDSEEEGEVVVNTISNDMKPMVITETEGQV